MADVRDVVENRARPEDSVLDPVVQVAVHVVRDPVAVHVVGVGEDD